MSSNDAPPTILQRVAMGDHDAVDQCIGRYTGLVFSIAKRYVHDHAMAEDLTQEIFIEIWRNAVRFDPSRSHEPTYISMISRRRAIDASRKRRGYRAEQISDDDLELVADRGQIDTMVWGEELSQVLECLHALEKGKRDVLVLNLRDGTSLSRIARKLDMPLGTIKSHARRGLLAVRRCMGLDPSGATCEVPEVEDGKV